MNININKSVARRPALYRARHRRAAKAMFVSATAVVLLAGIVYCTYCVLRFLSRHPDFVIRKVQIINNRTITVEEIMRIAGIRAKMNMYSTSLFPIAHRLEEHPDIKNAEIIKKYPDTLIIKIREREPIAIAVTTGKQPDVPIDADGVMLSKRKMEHALHVPKMYGLEHIAYEPGKKVSDPRMPTALKFLVALSTGPQSTYLDVRKISFDQPNDIVIQTASVDEIHLGTAYSPENVLRLIGTINDLRFQRKNAQKVDLRFKDVVVTPRRF